jgi:trigger factor
MDVRITQKATCRVVVNATVPPDEVGTERERVIAEFVRAARLDGFRRGRAPRPLVERRFAQQIDEDLTEGLVRGAWARVREEQELRPAGPLEVGRTGFAADGTFEVTAELDVYPEVQLPGLDGFKPEPIEVRPTQADVEEAMRQLRERQAAWEPVDGVPAADGMLVEAEVHGSFPEGGGDEFHEERSLFELGRGEVHEEVERAVIGRLIGDEVSAERTLGPEAGPERDGKRVAYRVLLKGLRRKRLPEVDDDFARSLGVPEGLTALRERVLARLRVERERARWETWRAALVNYLSGGHELPLPDGVVREELRRELVSLAEGFMRRGIDPSSQVDWSTLEPDVKRRVEEKLRAELVLDVVARQLGVTVGDADLDAEVERQAAGLKVPFAELRGNLAKGGGLERVRALLVRERAVDAILRPALTAAEGTGETR